MQPTSAEQRRLLNTEESHVSENAEKSSTSRFTKMILTAIIIFVSVAFGILLCIYFKKLILINIFVILGGAAMAAGLKSWWRSRSNHNRTYSGEDGSRTDVFISQQTIYFNRYKNNRYTNNRYKLILITFKEAEHVKAI